MTSQRKYTLIWLLLPLLTLRGLVPAGLMIDTSHDRLSIVICSGGVYKTVTVSEQGSDAAGRHSEQREHDRSICPFAVAATSAPAPTALSMVAGAVSAIGVVTSDVVALQSPFGPSRTQQSRAPPYFS